MQQERFVSLRMVWLLNSEDGSAVPSELGRCQWFTRTGYEPKVDGIVSQPEPPGGATM